MSDNKFVTRPTLFFPLSGISMLTNVDSMNQKNTLA